MDRSSYLLSAEACSSNVPTEPVTDLHVPIIADSRGGSSPKPKRSWRALAWPCRVVAVIGHAIGIVIKLVFIVASLTLYALLLMPGFLRMIVYYFFSKDVVRGVIYGSKPRQRLDLYFPPNARNDTTYPVVIYITGGAWTIGYKAWGALLGRRLSEQGVLVACLDYRNFPQGDALDMLEDVNTGISWVLSRIHRFGGDPDSITLVGQSAGGHLAGLALMKQAEQAARGHPVLGSTPAWSPSRLGAFVGVSGAFDLEALSEHRGGHFRGLLDRILALDEMQEGEGIEGGGAAAGCTEVPPACGDGSKAPQPQLSKAQPWIGDVEQAGSATGACAAAAAESGGGGGSNLQQDRRQRRPPPSPPLPRRKRPAYDKLSPLQAARRLPPGAAGMLPYVLLIHGSADKTVPAEGSARLSQALQLAGALCCRCELVPGKTHTAFLLEDPMRGGRDLLSDAVLGAALRGRPTDVEEGHSDGGGGGGGGGGDGGRVYGSLCPAFLCDLAGWVCPF